MPGAEGDRRLMHGAGGGDADRNLFAQPSARRKPRQRDPEDALDTRSVLAAYDFTADCEMPPQVIPAAPGFALLMFYDYVPRSKRIIGFTTHAVIAWKVLCAEHLLPLAFERDITFHKMCDLAVQDPGGRVMSFEGRSFRNEKAWLADRRRRR